MKAKNTLDLTYIKTMAANDPETMKALLQALQKELRTHLPKARKLYQAKDWNGLERFCHHFKSTISFAGHPGIVATNRALWDMAKAGADPSGKGAALIGQLEKQGQEISRQASKALKNL
ncbi:MAG: hypothetical protein AAGJ82_11725 [Bacteroidota bacterium]